MKNYRSTIIGFAVLVVLMTAGAAQSLAGTNTVFTDDIVDGTIKHGDIKANSIGGSRFLDNSVTGSKILDGGVTGADIANNSVSGTDIADGTLTGADMAPATGIQPPVIPDDDSVTSAKIVDDSVTGDDINESTLGITGRLTDIEQVQTEFSIPAGATASGTKECPAGKSLLSGGVLVVGRVNASYPNSFGRSWHASVTSEAPGPGFFTVYALCATIS